MHFAPLILFTLYYHFSFVGLPALECDFKPYLFHLLQLMALLLLRHALSVTDSDADDDPSTFFSVSDLSSFCYVVYIAAAVLIPCSMYS